MQRPPFGRVVILVLDSVGVGEMPDAVEFGDAGSDTLGHVAASRQIELPNLAALGLGNIRPLPGIPPARPASGSYGKMALASRGKDTTSGHWEMMGLPLKQPFPTYPEGFPPEVIEAFESAVGRRVLGNRPASGTEIIRELGEEHVRSGNPIVYTSADSVFQIAAHEGIIPIDELYRMCETARAILQGPHRVGRVIARPFIGEPGAFARTERRKDYAIPPLAPTVLDGLQAAGVPVVAVGKIASIFCYRGVDVELKSKNNRDTTVQTLNALRDTPRGLVFANFVDFDMLYGHRNDVEGYARALEEFDRELPSILAALKPDDLLVMVSDHGCDPSTPSTDHSREYCLLLAYGKTLPGDRRLGVRRSLADLGASVAENFGVPSPAGTSFLAELR